MKLLFANKFFFLNGGSETVMFQERAFMLSQGAKIIDFSMQDERNLPSPYAEYFIPPVSYRKGPLLSRLKAAASFVHSGEAVRRLKRLLAGVKPDIAHLHNIYHQLTPSIIPVLKDAGAKVVMTLHDGKLVCPSYLMLNRGKPCTACAGRKFHLPISTHCQGSRLQEALFCAEAYFHKWKGSYDGVDRFIAPSRFLADLVAQRVGRERVVVIPNGIDPDVHLPTWEDEGYILYYGRLSEEKGVATLLAAHAAMKNQVPLVIVGTGPLEAELKAQNPANVTFAGYRSGEELWNYVRRASCLVTPSEWYENAPMTVLEGMSFGKPVIGSRIGGIPEQIQDGETGLLRAPGKAEEFACALDKLMADKELRARMGKAGRGRLEGQFSLAMHNDRLLALYKAIL